MSVTRHSSTNMAMSVTVTLITLSTTRRASPVSARWAPITSLFRRVISAPVCVRVKNAIGMAWT